MLATYKEAVATPVTFEEAAGAMSAGLASVLQATPSVEVLALALAKTTLEAGRQGAKLWAYAKHWNLGNVKSGPKYSGMYTTFTCNERLVESGILKTIWFSPFGRLSGRGGVVVSEQYDNPPGHPQTRFRAYANAFDGAYQYVDFVASGRYVDAWNELLQGDAIGYVNALYAKKYFTADPDVYAKGVLSLHREFIAKLHGRPAPEMWIPSVEVIDGLVAKQVWNAQQVESWSAVEEMAYDANRASGWAQMLASDPDEETKPDPPRNS